MKESIINEIKSAYDLNDHKSVISNETLLFLSQFKEPSKVLLDLGIVSDSKTPIKCEIPCRSCKTLVVQKHTVDSLNVAIANNYPMNWCGLLSVVCTSCAEAETKHSERNVVMYDLANKLGCYIECGDKGLKTKELIDEFEGLQRLSPYYQRALSKELIAMPYDKFLSTRYWAIISYKVKQENSGTCKNCGHYGNDIDCHHKTYDRHGMEHIYWQSDLVPLCRNCHQEEHRLHPALRAPAPVGEVMIEDFINPF